MSKLKRRRNGSNLVNVLVETEQIARRLLIANTCSCQIHTSVYDRVHILILLLRIFAGVEQRPDQVLTSQVKAQQYLTRSNINDPNISQTC